MTVCGYIGKVYIYVVCLSDDKILFRSADEYLIKESVPLTIQMQIHVSMINISRIKTVHHLI